MLSTSTLPVSVDDLRAPLNDGPRGLGPRPLIDELEHNPWWLASVLRAGSPFRRRFRAAVPLALVGAVFVFLLTGSGYWSRPSGLVLELYLPIRLLLLYRAARLAVAASRRDLRPGNLTPLIASPLSGRDLTLGWAVAAWSRAVPETFAAFILLAPLILPWGFTAGLIALVEMVHLILLQGLAAVIAAGLMAGFRHRHEAATAGWLSAVFTFPAVFFVQTFMFAVLLAMLPLAILLLLGASLPAGWPELDMSLVLNAAAVFLAAVYAVWMPVATVKEIYRQLDLAGEASARGLRFHLHAERPSGKRIA
jgi:hypothetical protein